MKALSVGSKFELEILEEKEERKKQEQDKKERRAAFKELQSTFCSWPPPAGGARGPAELQVISACTIISNGDPNSSFCNAQ